ncbi:MAG: hypothetical protein ACK5N4_06665 [Parabacteroides gordonii]|jgi:hypothetical protein|uniref:hypothetical protein n=1 Tax=Parabacteroides gordonii TaxID=574930 RepID=UPI003A8C1B0B
MEADFTLVPFGGLGNRMYAICSAIAYCQKNKKSLKIIWFRDHNLNCSVSDLFTISAEMEFVDLKDASLMDLILRDNPRRRNLWIPKFFQRFLFDRRIYVPEVYDVVSIHKKESFGDLEKFKHIFMVSYWYFYSTPNMWKPITINPKIEVRVNEIMEKCRKSNSRVIGVHIRRTDNIYSIKESPTELFIFKMEEEVKHNKGNVCFYLASDSLEVKKELVSRFGNQIITSMKPTSRNNKQGIIDAFVELNILSRTDKIYASSKSSFSELAHYLSNNEFEIVRK